MICTEEKTASQRRWRQKKGLGTGKVGTPRKRTQQARGGLPWDWTH
ncbi:hypothetical protein PBI_MRMAGOO_135 [Mycobacterium phage MrMagoo]|uniref:Uncharacterized protein n=1 Tax=Mycobacterium phage MrMagoo TaxID=1927020 RepID=A0A1L6BYN8_9CAUD|nr:hypothetical protein J4U04_gp145 [Mycobacterium phage MrMagoo]APQ42217.1 hypothetical protein PBI_MRMAGOO_135 [Mycobacterium phage MrMagoo]